MDEAKKIALKDAGVNAKDATFTKTELDRDDGVWSYELDFYTDSAEYDYEVHAETGDIRSKESELFGNQGQTSQEGSITLDEAKSIAAKHAGFSVNDVSFSKAKLETDDGVTAYETNSTKIGMNTNIRFRHRPAAFWNTIPITTIKFERKRGALCSSFLYESKNRKNKAFHFPSLVL